MKKEIIVAMVRVLKPALSDGSRAEQLLERFWRDKIALVWDVRDVHTAANEREIALTDQEAIKVLQELQHGYNKQYGLRWSDFTSYIEESALGRKMTKAELKRFVEKNVVTIDCMSRKRRQARRPAT